MNFGHQLPHPASRGPARLVLLIVVGALAGCGQATTAPTVTTVTVTATPSPSPSAATREAYLSLAKKAQSAIKADDDAMKGEVKCTASDGYTFQCSPCLTQGQDAACIAQYAKLSHDAAQWLAALSTAYKNAPLTLRSLDSDLEDRLGGIDYDADQLAKHWKDTDRSFFITVDDDLQKRLNSWPAIPDA